MVRKGSVFACALVFSPVRMAGQTACPEGSSARARKNCLGVRGDFVGNSDWGVRIGKLKHGVGSGGNNFELKGQTILGKGDHDDERNDGWAGTV